MCIRDRFNLVQMLRYLFGFFLQPFSDHKFQRGYIDIDMAGEGLSKKALNAAGIEVSLLKLQAQLVIEYDLRRGLQCRGHGNREVVEETDQGSLSVVNRAISGSRGREGIGQNQIGYLTLLVAEERSQREYTDAKRIVENVNYFGNIRAKENFREILPECVVIIRFRWTHTRNEVVLAKVDDRKIEIS